MMILFLFFRAVCWKAYLQNSYRTSDSTILSTVSIGRNGTHTQHHLCQPSISWPRSIGTFAYLKAIGLVYQVSESGITRFIDMVSDRRRATRGRGTLEGLVRRADPMT